jgi:hypothetical protein
VAHRTQASKVCAWIGASNNFDPVSAAAAAGVDLARLLWVHCGVVQEAVKRPARSFVLRDKYLVPRPAKQGLHGGGFGAHPRGDAKGFSGAVNEGSRNCLTIDLQCERADIYRSFSGLAKQRNARNGSANASLLAHSSKAVAITRTTNKRPKYGLPQPKRSYISRATLVHFAQLSQPLHSREVSLCTQRVAVGPERTNSWCSVLAHRSRHLPCAIDMRPSVGMQCPCPASRNF